ncbi:MAG: hypothetical protein LC754_03560 [Acidobacteria bacterium]|nr:hypothetical protein [Acidobacteriota bacterium]
MKFKSFARLLALAALVLACAVVALGDTIRMKDGQVIRGQIVSFREQQFTVLIGAGNRTRRSRITLYMEDVDSIEFDSAGGGDTGASGNTGDNPDTGAARIETTRPTPQTPTPRPSQPQPRPTLGNDSGVGTTSSGASRNSGASQPGSGGSDSQFFPVRIRVRADNMANGWTDSGLMVRRGQRLRVSATGRVSLGLGRFSTPTGLPRVMDTEKLMKNEPTGGLIAVIGDDNDDFIFIGTNRDFVAPRDGRLFLGVNEGKLDDNTGTYDALIEVEPITSGGN